MPLAPRVTCESDVSVEGGGYSWRRSQSPAPKPSRGLNAGHKNFPSSTQAPFPPLKSHHCFNTIRFTFHDQIAGCMIGERNASSPPFVARIRMITLDPSRRRNNFGLLTPRGQGHRSVLGMSQYRVMTFSLLWLN